MRSTRTPSPPMWMTGRWDGSAPHGAPTLRSCCGSNGLRPLMCGRGSGANSKSDSWARTSTCTSSSTCHTTTSYRQSPMNYYSRSTGGDWGSVPAWVAAGMSALFGVLLWRSSTKSKKAQAESRQAKQAVRAARDAADAESRTAAALERTADIHTAQERRAAEEFEAEKESPWDLLPISGDDYCVLVNRTGRPKYHVHIGGSAVPPPGVRVHESRPGKSRGERSPHMGARSGREGVVARGKGQIRSVAVANLRPANQNRLIGGGQPGHRPARRHGPGARVSMCQHPRPRRQSDTG